MSANEKARAEAVEAIGDRLGRSEAVLAVLPFATTPKRKDAGKTRDGIYQSIRRYRPLVLTDRRLFVLDAGRTPHPRGEILGEFLLASVSVVDVIRRRFNQNRVILDLPGSGPVPFDVGGYEVDDLAQLRATLERS